METVVCVLVCWIESLVFIKLQERHQGMQEDGSLGKSVAESELPDASLFLLIVQDPGQEGSEQVKRGNWAQIFVVTDSSLTMSLAAFIGNWTIKWYHCSGTECFCTVWKSLTWIPGVWKMREALSSSRVLHGKDSALSNKINYMICFFLPSSCPENLFRLSHMF